jgi:hypothetical protein
MIHLEKTTESHFVQGKLGNIGYIIKGVTKL